MTTTAPTFTLIPPDTKDVQVEQSSIVAKAKALVVTSAPEHEVALLELKAIATAEKRVKELFDKPKKDANQAHKSLCDAEKSLLDPLVEARRIVTSKATIYEQEMQRRAEEEARQREDEARKAEEQRQLEDAILAESSGDQAAADAIMAEPVVIPTVEPAPRIATVSGITSRTTYGAKVVDLMALIKYVAKNPHEAALLEVNTTALNGRAKSMKEGFKLPGCELVKTTGKSVKVG